MRRALLRAPVVLGLLVLALLVLLPGTGSLARAGESSSSSGEPTWTATLDKADVEASDSNDPAELDPESDAEVTVTVNNDTGEPLTVRSVSLRGSVLGLTFFSYTTRVDLAVAAGATGTRTFTVDLSDLAGQATGLLPATMSLIGPDRTVIAERSLTVDVQGSLLSVYGVFGLVVAAGTVVLLVTLLSRLATSRLPPNRWRRAVRFGVVGIGIGLTATFTLSALSLKSPDAATWVTVVVVCAVVAFTLGYLSPDPSADDDFYDDQAAYDDDLYEPGGRTTDELPPYQPKPRGVPTNVPGLGPLPRQADAQPPSAPRVIDLRDTAPQEQTPPASRGGSRETARGQVWQPPPRDAE